MKFLAKDGTFDVNGFEKTVEVMITAQDSVIDFSSFPTSQIAENSHRYRPLGLGYANLGALLMNLGLPYDSDEGRATAAAITALMTGKAYQTSSMMAQRIGTFKRFKENKEPMIGVMKQHREALNGIDRTKIPNGLESIVDEAEKVWEDVIKSGEKYGYRNAQVSVLAPTGTISFMMDCDTTGIEPDLGLIKTKKLSEGGVIRIVNQSVDSALKRRGYDKEEREKFARYIQENETIEGSGIKPEHLAIFDCALKPKKGTRFISPRGHLKMMAAVQPFLSGAISKTVNLPAETTPEEIEELYMEAWKMGLKSVAVYRDGSKRNQPLSTGSGKNLEGKLSQVPVRRKLPITRPSVTHRFDVAGHEGYLTVGLYNDGSPGELFIRMSKEGSTIGGLMDSLATTVSIALQYGVPLKSLTGKFKSQRFEPSGLVFGDDSGIKEATSLVDYIGNWLELNFNGGKKEVVEVKPANLESAKETEEVLGEELGSFCPLCGTQTRKKGHCNEVCPTCNWVNPRGCGG
jgi:ribonucleoside-diphosphate reductase alpha chain